MPDLDLLVSLAFGQTAGRALWIAALASLLVTTRRRPSVVAALALLLDQAIPLWGLAAEHGRTALIETLLWQAQTLPRDALWLAVRGLGMWLVVLTLWRLRLALHGRRSVVAPA